MCCVLLFSSCNSGKTDKEVYYSPYEYDFGSVINAEIVIRDYGSVMLSLFPDEAPETVDYFIKLAESGFYDGLTFHRIISGFMIQGGDPTGTGWGDSSQKSIIGEFYSNGRPNRISHVTGVISMARRSGQNNSADSQFFIMVSDREEAGYLNGNYAAFGCVVSGMDIIKRISEVMVDLSSYRPLEDVIIETINVQ